MSVGLWGQLNLVEVTLTKAKEETSPSKTCSSTRVLVTTRAKTSTSTYSPSWMPYKSHSICVQRSELQSTVARLKGPVYSISPPADLLFSTAFLRSVKRALSEKKNSLWQKNEESYLNVLRLQQVEEQNESS